MKNYTVYKLAALFYITVFLTSMVGQDFRILLDEDFSDWESIAPSYQDSLEDGVNIDFRKFKCTNYDGKLFIYLEVGSEINLQEQNYINLFIDTDNNDSTGNPIKGIGADLQFAFGYRSGNYNYGTSSFQIYHDDIGLVSLPTVTSDTFELMIDTTIIIGGHKVFTSPIIKIVLIDDTFGGDQIPNEDGGISYQFAVNEPLQTVSYSIKKPKPELVRIVSYNIERDNLFDASRKDGFARIMKALDPQIIGFQEIYNHSAEQTAALMEEFIPSSENEQWYAAKQGTDIITVSRFPITQSFYIEGNGAFKIDLSAKYTKDLLMINAHTPCCANNADRQKEIDAFMAFVREAKEEGGELTLENETPIVILGDMNLVGFKQQQTTLITGDIVNTNIYGEKFIPDWDGTDLMDLASPTTHHPSKMTWYDEGSAYAPGRLDYIVYTNSVIESENSFVLFTNTLPQDSLDRNNLYFNDVTNSSDHLPSVADFNWGETVGIKESKSELTPHKFILSQNYPNPFNPATKIIYETPIQAQVQLQVFDVLGREFETLVDEIKPSGIYEIIFKINSFKVLSSGIYFYRLIITDTEKSSSPLFIDTKMMMLLK